MARRASDATRPVPPALAPLAACASGHPTPPRACGEIPHQAIPLGTHGRLRGDAGPIDQLAPLVVLVVDRTPAHLALRQRLAEGPVLGPAPPQPGRGPAATPVHMGPVRDRGQRAVGPVEEVPSPRQLTEQVPGGAAGPVIDPGAALGLERDRDPAVLGDRRDEQQSLPIGAVVLVIAPGDGEPLVAPAARLLGGVGVVAEGGDGRRVVGRLAPPHRELAYRVGPDRHDERAPGAGEQPVQAPPPQSSFRAAPCSSEGPGASGSYPAAHPPPRRAAARARARGPSGGPSAPAPGRSGSVACPAVGKRGGALPSASAGGGDRGPAAVRGGASRESSPPPGRDHPTAVRAWPGRAEVLQSCSRVWLRGPLRGDGTPPGPVAVPVPPMPMVGSPPA